MHIDRHLQKPSKPRPLRPHHPRLHQLVIREPLNEPADRDPGLDLGEFLAEASVHPRRECIVVVREPRDIQTIRVLKLGGVAVHGADGNMDTGARFQGDLAQCGFLVGAAVADLVGGLEAEEFFDGGHDVGVGVGLEEAELGGVLGEGDEAVSL